MQVSESESEGSIEKGLGQKKARRVKIELSEAESNLKELHIKRVVDVALFREKAAIQLKTIESEILCAKVSATILLFLFLSWYIPCHDMGHIFHCQWVQSILTIMPRNPLPAFTSISFLMSFSLHAPRYYGPYWRMTNLQNFHRLFKADTSAISVYPST